MTAIIRTSLLLMLICVSAASPQSTMFNRAQCSTGLRTIVAVSSFNVALAAKTHTTSGSSQNNDQSSSTAETFDPVMTGNDSVKLTGDNTESP
jgi:hypothetical protein